MTRHDLPLGFDKTRFGIFHIYNTYATIFPHMRPIDGAFRSHGMILTPLLAQSLKEIPVDPTPHWIIAAGLVIGGSCMAYAVAHAFRSASAASAGTRAAVTEMLTFCQGESTRRETVINKICDTHEIVGTKIADKVNDLRHELVKHTAETGSKLSEIHEDLKLVTPRRGHKTTGDA